MITIEPRTNADVKITVTDTATNLYTLIDTAASTTNAQKYYDQKFANGVFITPEDGDIRYLTDNISPTATNGQPVSSGTTWYLPGVDLSQLKLIRQGSSNVTCSVVIVRSEQVDTPAAVAYDVTLEVADVQIGAVEIKDQDSATRADVGSFTDDTVNLDGNNGLITGAVLFGRVDNSNVKSVMIDEYTQDLIFVDHAHHEAHEGNHYTFTKVSTVNNGGTFEAIITVPDTTSWPHLAYSIQGTAITKVEAYEGTTHTAGAALNTWNNNRNSSNTAGMILSANSGGGADGTLIYEDQFGTATQPGRPNTGGLSRGDQEWILKQNTKYLLKITSFTDGNVISVRLGWYEDASK